MGLVKLRAIERSCKMILMCMADNGNDQGHNIYRSMDYLAREACCHKRTVQKKIGQMVRIGLLEDVGRKTHGRGHLRNFRLDLDALLTLFPDCHKVAEDVDPSALAGLIEDAEAEARAAGWVPQEEREDPEKGGAAPPFSEGEKGGAGDQKGGAESTKGWPQRPPEPLRTVLEPYGARADAPGGDPDGPPGEPADPQPNTLAAEWRALVPQIVAAVEADRRGRGSYVEFLARDAFVTARREGCWHPGRFGRLSGRVRPAVFLRLAVADARALHDFGRNWRHLIHKATGYVIRPKLDPRAIARKAHREEREKAERDAEKTSKPAARRASR